MQIPGPGVWAEPRDHGIGSRKRTASHSRGCCSGHRSCYRSRGTSTVAHLDENIAAALIELTHAQVQQLNAAEVDS